MDCSKSEEEASSTAVHLTLVDPFQFPSLSIEGSFLQPAEFECKSRTEFLNSTRVLIIEDISGKGDRGDGWMNGCVDKKRWMNE